MNRKIPSCTRGRDGNSHPPGRGPSWLPTQSPSPVLLRYPVTFMPRSKFTRFEKKKKTRKKEIRSPFIVTFIGKVLFPYFISPFHLKSNFTPLNSCFHRIKRFRLVESFSLPKTIFFFTVNKLNILLRFIFSSGFSSPEGHQTKSMSPEVETHHSRFKKSRDKLRF